MEVSFQPWNIIPPDNRYQPQIFSTNKDLTPKQNETPLSYRTVQSSDQWFENASSIPLTKTSDFQKESTWYETPNSLPLAAKNIPDFPANWVSVSSPEAWSIPENNSQKFSPMFSVNPPWQSNGMMEEQINSTLPLEGIATIPSTSYVPPVGLEVSKGKSFGKGKVKVNRTFQNNILFPENKLVGLDIEEELNKQDLYKTELCKSWVESGLCRYGDKCQFAHGPNELRPVLRHPKYKTEICKTFHTYGTCPYGKRCRFVHTSPSENSPPKVEAEQQKQQESVKPPPPPPEEEVTTVEKKKGSKLPFFQKLHRQSKKKN